MQNLVEKFLVRNQYTHFSKKDITLQLEIHPENPSFRAITDTLDYFGIENLAANVPEDALPLLPDNFLTIIEENHLKQLVLVTKKEKLVYTTAENGERKKYTLEEFKQIWSRNIIAIEETKKERNSVSLKTVGLGVGAVLLIAYLITKQITLVHGAVLAVAASGLYISYLLIKEKIGYHSVSVLNICTAIPNSNCNDVINSKGGEIAKNFSLADASFIYFSLLLFQEFFFELNGIATLLILLSIPAIIYSLYYQGTVLKKWCPLCLGIAALLLVLNATLLVEANLDFNTQSILKLVIVGAFIVPIYFFTRDLVKNQKKNEQELMAAARFKRNPNIVKNLIKEAQSVEKVPLFNNETSIGNPNGTYQITTYTNPLCGYCKAAFESYVKMIKMNENIKILIRFSSGIENHEAPSTKIAAKLIEVYHEKGQNAFIKAYKNWFDNRDIDSWVKEYGTPKYTDTAADLLKQHIIWSKKNNITHTPATILDNKLFPSTYGYSDLVYVLHDIIEFQKNKKSP